MSRAVIDQKKCDQSLNCKAKRECTVDAFVRQDDKWVINENCVSCGICLDACCQKCIKIED